MRILAGDVGGTKTALGLYECDGSDVSQLAYRIFASGEHDSLRHVLSRFVGSHPEPIGAACFGIAGPILDGVSSVTNLPWVVRESELAEFLGAPVSLINDFHAVALGVRELPASAFCVLQPGVLDPQGPYVVLGAGTGLGEAIGVPTPQGVRVLASEGGHADFAPRDEVEIALLRFMLARHGRVSVERVVSGLGLADLYDFVVEEKLAVGDPATRLRFGPETAGAVISERAREGEPAAERTLELFVSLYGAEAGNFALKLLPSGGVFIAGGIAPRLLERMQSGSFMASFLAKGRMSALLSGLHVAVVLDKDVGLVGARAHGAVLCGSRSGR